MKRVRSSNKLCFLQNNNLSQISKALYYSSVLSVWDLISVCSGITLATAWNYIWRSTVTVIVYIHQQKVKFVF